MEIEFKFKTPKQARLAYELIEMRIGAWLDSGELDENEQEEMDMLEQMQEELAKAYKVELLAQFRVIEPEMRGCTAFKEYADEGEHGDGYSYWMQFDSALQLREDYLLYLKESEE